MKPSESKQDLIDLRCDQFELAWKREPPARIEDLLVDRKESVFRELLRELIALDLEFRIRTEGCNARLLEDYLLDYGDDIRDETIVFLALKEFRYRQQWGDHPDIYQYFARFPRLAESLQVPLSSAALEVCPTVVSVYKGGIRFHQCRLTGPLEIGRQRQGEPAPYATVRDVGTDRLVVALNTEVGISRRQLLVEPVAKNRNRISNLGRSKVKVELGEVLVPEEASIVELPFVIRLGDLAVRCADR